MSTTRLSIWTLLEESLLCTQPARVEHSPSSIHMYKVSIFTRKMRARGVGALEVKQLCYLKRQLFLVTQSRENVVAISSCPQKKNFKVCTRLSCHVSSYPYKAEVEEEVLFFVVALFSLQTRVGDAKRKRRQNHHGRPLLHISHQ